MKRFTPYFLLFLAAVLVIYAGCSQIGATKTSAQLKTEPLAPADAYKIFYDLNEKKKLLEPFGFPPNESIFYYNALKPENCFGFTLHKKQRIAGESSGEFYGATRNGDQEMIGFFYSDTDFSIENNSFKKGSYAVSASPTILVLSRNIVSSATEIPLKTPIAESLFKKSVSSPRFSLILKDQEIFLNIEGNSFLIKIK